MRLLRLLLLLTVFLIPLIGAPGNFGYEQAKVFFFITLLTICGFVWTIYSIKHKVKVEWSGVLFKKQPLYL